MSVSAVDDLSRDGVDSNLGCCDEPAESDVDVRIDVNEPAAGVDNGTVGHEGVGGIPCVVSVDRDRAAGRRDVAG